MKRFLSFALPALLALPASAVWTVETYAQNNCTHKISDGNWEIGVYRYSDEDWSLGKQVGVNGTSYIAGSGDLDLRSLAVDCGVVLKRSNNGALEKNSNITSVRRASPRRRSARFRRACSTVARRSRRRRFRAICPPLAPMPSTMAAP